MSLSVFGEKAFVPNDEALSETLFESKIVWDDLIKHIQNTYENVCSEWKYYSKSAGWTLVVKSRKRTLIYFIPLKGSFKVNFVFGEKAVAVAQNADLSESVLALILEAKAYVEGRSFMVDVKSNTEAEWIEKLLRIKNDH